MTQPELAEAIRKELERGGEFDLEKMDRIKRLCDEAGVVPIERMTLEQLEVWLGKK